MTHDLPASNSRAGKRFRNLRRSLAQLISGSSTEANARDAAKDGLPATSLTVDEFEESEVRDVMISRVDIASLDVNTTLEDVLKLFAEEAHSRMPVVRDSLDEPLGFVHIKDVVAELVEAGWSAETLASKPLDRLCRKVLFVPETMPLPNLLLQMQTSRTHMALVVDEYGGTDGMVCLEDVVEAIVGDLEDEHDDTTPPVRRRGRAIWDIDALAEIDDVEEATGIKLLVPEFEDEVDTVGGLVSALAARVPRAGDIIEHPSGYLFEVLAADPRRVMRVRLKTAAKTPIQPYTDAEVADEKNADAVKRTT